MRAAARKGGLDARRDQKGLFHLGIIVRRVRNVIVLFVSDVAVWGLFLFNKIGPFDAHQHFAVTGVIDRDTLLIFVNIRATSKEVFIFDAQLEALQIADICGGRLKPIFFKPPHHIFDEGGLGHNGIGL